MQFFIHYYVSQICKLCCIFRKIISSLYITISDCVLVMRNKHMPNFIFLDL
jgi:hypothetical protein